MKIGEKMTDLQCLMIFIAGGYVLRYILLRGMWSSLKKDIHEIKDKLEKR